MCVPVFVQTQAMPYDHGIFRHLRHHVCISKGALERSSSTYLLEINPRVVSTDNLVFYFHAFTFPFRDSDGVTLDPNKFTKKKQHLHIGNLQSFKPCIALHNQSSPVVCPQIYYDSHMGLHSSFPSDTKAFLHYFTLPKNPVLQENYASELHQVMIDDPVSFESGSDLLSLNGQPWSRPLYVPSKCYIPLYEKLREGRLAPDDLDAVLSAFPTTLPRVYGGQQLHTLNDTFIDDFSSLYLCFTVITEQGMETLRFIKPFF